MSGIGDLAGDLIGSDAVKEAVPQLIEKVVSEVLLPRAFDHLAAALGRPPTEAEIMAYQTQLMSLYRERQKEEDDEE